MQEPLCFSGREPFDLTRMFRKTMRGGRTLTRNEAVDRIRRNMEHVMVGKRHEVELVLVALLSGGHVLIEDVPGVGKTTLVRSLAKSLGCTFNRIQFTPDLLPSDVTGISIYNQRSGEFEFRPGPIFSQIVLADEINRTSPKTQSALLEAMEEGQATVDGVTHALPQPFLVLATQNPIEYEGTFPLPEAQLDRFLLRLRLGYPSAAEEAEIVERAKAQPLQRLEPVATPAEIVALQEQVRGQHVHADVRDYAVRLVQATRTHRDVYLGASPRASIALYRCAQALALLRGRDYVQPEDVKELAPAVLAHRLVLRPEVRLSAGRTEAVLDEILAAVPVPVAA